MKPIFDSSRWWAVRTQVSELARSLTEAIGRAITQTLGETEASTPFSEIISLNLPFLLANLLFIFVEWHFNIRNLPLSRQEFELSLSRSLRLMTLPTHLCSNRLPSWRIEDRFDRNVPKLLNYAPRIPPPPGPVQATCSLRHLACRVFRNYFGYLI